MTEMNSGAFDLEVVNPRMKRAAVDAVAPYRNDAKFRADLNRGKITDPKARDRLLDAWSKVARELLAERNKKGVTVSEFDGLSMLGRLEVLAGTAWGFEKFLNQCYLTLIAR